MAYSNQPFNVAGALNPRIPTVYLLMKADDGDKEIFEGMLAHTMRQVGMFWGGSTLDDADVIGVEDEHNQPPSTSTAGASHTD
jgi:hypothetical protein